MTAPAGQRIVLEPPENTPPELARYLYENFAILQYAAVVPYTNRTPVTVANSTTETQLISIPFGANDLFHSSAGQLTFAGAYTRASASHTFDLRFYLDTLLLHTVSLSSGGSTPTDAGWLATFYAMMLQDGTAGQFRDWAQLLTNDDISGVAETSSSHAFDTTVPHELRVTAQWSVAAPSTSLTMYQAHYLSF